MASSTHRFLQTRRTVIAVLLGTSLGAGYFLYGDLNRGAQKNNGVQIATVGKVRGKVRSKSQGSFVWNDLRPNAQIFLKDTVSTGDDGFASILMKEGSELELEPNSFVVIDRLENQKMSLLQGAMVLRGADGQGGKRISRGGDDAADVRELFVRLTEPASLSVLVAPTGAPRAIGFKWSGSSPAGGALKVQWAKNRSFTGDGVGTATQSAGANTATASLNPGIYYWRVVNMENTPVSETAQFTLFEAKPFQLNAPLGKALSWDETLRFQWTNPGLDVAASDNRKSNHVLEISREANFGSLVSQKAIDARSSDATVAGLSEGDYYWRIRSTLGDVNVASEPQYFNLERARLLLIDAAAPADEALLPAREPIRLSWKSNAETADARVEVRTADGAPFRSERATRNFVLLERMPPGNYQWRVASTKAKFRAETKWRTFSVLPSDAFALSFPLRAQQILVRGDIRPFEFRWDEDASATRYRVELATDRDFEKRVAVREFKSNRASSEDLLPGGSDQYYYWRVISLEGDRPRRMSRVSEFRYAVLFDLPAPALLAPLNEAKVNPGVDRRPPRFSWAPSKNAKKYVFSLFPARSESDVNSAPLVRATVNGTTFEAPELAEGRYAWNVKAIDKNERSGETSPMRMVNIVYGAVLRAPASRSAEVQ